jgi:thymidylate synthase
MGVPRYHLDCSLTQRSADSFLGLPYNIASYALLTMIIAKMVNMAPGDFIWKGEDVHIYKNHMDQVLELMRRKPKKLPIMKISGDWETVDDIEFSDFKLLNYEPHPHIEGKLSTGLR